MIAIGKSKLMFMVTAALLLITISAAKSMKMTNRPSHGIIRGYGQLSTTQPHLLGTGSLLHRATSIRSGAFLGLRGGASDASSGSDDLVYIPPPLPPPPEEVKCAPTPSEEVTDADLQNLEQKITTSTTAIIGGPSPGFLRRSLPSFPWHRLPDWLTYARCSAIPILGLLFYYPTKYPHYRAGLTATVFGLASFTDYLDGYLARRWQISTSFGAFLDPVADKLMVSTALCILSGRYGKYVAIPTSIILAREIAVSALREWMAQKQLRDSVKVGFQGKVKTAATMVALTILLMVPSTDDGTLVLTAPYLRLYTTGLVLLGFSAVITLTSGLVYFKSAAPTLLSDTILDKNLL